MSWMRVESLTAAVGWYAFATLFGSKTTQLDPTPSGETPLVAGCPCVRYRVVDDGNVDIWEPDFLEWQAWQAQRILAFKELR